MPERVVLPIHGADHCPGGPDPIPCLTPSTASPHAEWIWLTTTTNWDVTPTILDFSVGGGDYDLVTPTFDINASNNLEINKGGAYDFHLYCIQVANDGSGTVWTHVRIEFSKLAGPNASGPHGWVTGGPYIWTKTTYWPNQPLSGNEGDPHLHTFAFWDSDDFVGTPFELQVTAVKYWDGVETAETLAINRLLVVRVGDPLT